MTHRRLIDQRFPKRTKADAQESINLKSRSPSQDGGFNQIYRNQLRQLSFFRRSSKPRPVDVLRFDARGHRGGDAAKGICKFSLQVVRLTARLAFITSLVLGRVQYEFWPTLV